MSLLIKNPVQRELTAGIIISPTALALSLMEPLKLALLEILFQFNSLITTPEALVSTIFVGGLPQEISKIVISGMRFFIRTRLAWALAFPEFLEINSGV